MAQDRPDISKQEIKDWLARIGKDRQWLADLCGSAVDTVNAWFSIRRDFPTAALIIIQAKMRAQGLDTLADLSKVQFTLLEWEKLELARTLAGYKDRTDFYRDALSEKADRIIAEEKRAQKIAEMPKAAEPRAAYQARKKGRQPTDSDGDE